MRNNISKEEYEELKFEYEFFPTSFCAKLKELGIIAKPYRSYKYYDISGEPIGDSADLTLRELLEDIGVSISK